MVEEKDTATADVVSPSRAEVVENADVPPPPEQVICLRFKAGKCRQGRCRFFHDVASRLPRPPSPVSRSSATAAASVDIEDDAEDDLEGKSQKSTPWGALDYLLKGESVKTQRYLKEFAEALWLPEVAGRTGCKGLFSKGGRKLRKEVTEAFAVVHASRRALAKLDLGADGVVIIDVCCGKGMGSLILAQEFGNSTLHALDRNRHMDLAHFQEQSNIHFHEVDLFSAAAADLISGIAADAQSRRIPVLMVGIHLCGPLSPRLLDLFLGLSAPAVLVLCPCCLDRKKPAPKLAARRLRVDSHMYWCLSLLWMLPSTCRRELIVDDDVLSEKNTFILATKACDSAQLSLST
eukprot:gnl/TRDRNA2_/TRDRNA2_134254_c0_seq3.p1 gnl/TRDRNA2_/TRDRNA2_134254_c0~~gnl/TRDRNA2_/TRDRNA2_134254_c0_seq3.p1  ORF type:complete len:349 (-),score=42.62 gnl/TRDRNA2_/TRDRNA2_134254_c0_seq3:348-1394(-)